MPYRIITKHKIMIQYIIFDFLGEKVWEVLDCRTKAGQTRYEEVFQRPLLKKPRQSTQRPRKNAQAILWWFLTPESTPRPLQRKKRFYNREYNPAPPETIQRNQLPWFSQRVIESRSGSTGALYQLFLSAELDYFTRWQQTQNYSLFTSSCQVADIIRLELARIRLGFITTTQFLSILEDWPALQVECGVETKNLPTSSSYLTILQNIGVNPVLNYFLLLQRKCELLNLFDKNCDIWDARFLHAYQSAQKQIKTKEKPATAPGAYVHEGKYWGYGFLESRIINWRYRLPKYVWLVNPRWNDNQIFQETYKQMLQRNVPSARIFLADGGPKGRASRKLVQKNGNVPIFAAPKNAAGDVLITSKSRYFYQSEIPAEYWLILDPLFDYRTRIEQAFGYDAVTYHTLTLPHMTYELSYQYILLLNCEVLLTAIAGAITDQPHLITRPGAFRQLSLDSLDLSWQSPELTSFVL